MLTIKTEVRESRINGLGVFTLEPVPQGFMVWKYSSGFDTITTIADVKKMQKAQQEFMCHYAFEPAKGYDKRKALGILVLCIDNIRFMNHSIIPNLGSRWDEIQDVVEGSEPEHRIYALKDI